MSESDRPQPEVPPFPPELLREAAAVAGGWVYAIDPAYDPDGRVPPDGVVGAWAIGEDGLPTGEFRHNPNYRPSEMAQRLRDLGEGGPPAGRMPDERDEPGDPRDPRDAGE